MPVFCLTFFLPVATYMFTQISMVLNALKLFSFFPTGLAFGSDSNGSGVTILLELARIFGRLYRDAKTRPPLNLVFLLSAAGKWNFFGTKKWLEDHLDQVQNLFNLPNLIKFLPNAWPVKYKAKCLLNFLLYDHPM